MTSIYYPQFIWMSPNTNILIKSDLSRIGVINLIMTAWPPVGISSPINYVFRIKFQETHFWKLDSILFNLIFNRIKVDWKTWENNQFESDVSVSGTDRTFNWYFHFVLKFVIFLYCIIYFSGKYIPIPFQWYIICKNPINQIIIMLFLISTKIKSALWNSSTAPHFVIFVSSNKME